MRICERLLYSSIKLNRKGYVHLAKIVVLLIRVLCACDVSCQMTIGKHVQFVHNGLGVVIHPKTIIKDNVMIYQNVTIGGNTKEVNGKVINKGAPVIHENTVIYSGAVILGPISIGENCIVGANAVVTKNVPSNCTVIKYNEIKQRKNT